MKQRLADTLRWIAWLIAPPRPAAPLIAIRATGDQVIDEQRLNIAIRRAIAREARR